MGKLSQSTTTTTTTRHNTVKKRVSLVSVKLICYLTIVSNLVQIKAKDGQMEDRGVIGESLIEKGHLIGLLGEAHSFLL